MSEVGLLWDESFLWGLMAYKTLKHLGLPFSIVRSEDIKKGCLKDYRMLFVPGGWASNKLKALGEKGVEEIRRFVYEGGNYFGICGGAGLATMDGLGLLKIKRKPTRERVPSFSGRISLDINDHPIWQGIDRHSSVFYAWWPSQFVVHDRDIKVLATFQEALPDSYSSDLNVGDIRKNGNWEELEELYGINLDPERLRDEPAVVEGRFGKGKVLLSLIHFDTPGDENGAEVLTNIWEYLGGQSNRAAEQQEIQDTRYKIQDNYHVSCIVYHGSWIEATALLLYCSEIIDFGIRNFLWFWRTPMILQWRRGVRGLEYCTLYVMARELVGLERQYKTEKQSNTENNSHDKGFCSTDLLRYCSIFKEKALRLLMLERQAMQNGIINYEYSPDPEIQVLRKELFGRAKSHGGLFKEILDKIDKILYESLNKSTPP